MSRLFTGRIRLIGALVMAIMIITPTLALAGGPPDKVTVFICPSVNTHNDRGMWVIGAHGAYYVNVPSQGGVNAADGDPRVYVTVPAGVVDRAQLPAGWGLYKDYPSYPNFEGMAGLLSEGLSNWLGSPAGWQEGDGAMVVNNGDGTYTVTNARLMESITINYPIPIYSAVFW